MVYFIYGRLRYGEYESVIWIKKFIKQKQYFI